MNEGGSSRFRCSVIIPVWNDRDSLAAILPALRKIDNLHEVIVVDASGDSDATELSRANGAICIRAPKPSRGEQMNLGAAAATGDVLLFHHADTELTAAHTLAIDDALSDPAVVAGAFHRKFDGRHRHLDWLEKLARIHSRFGKTIFGDQSIFVRRDVFQKMGGFAPIPLMEDVEFSNRLRAAGKVQIIDPPLKSSARRHMSRGPWRTTIQNVLLLLLYKIGVSPERLHRWYYGTRASAGSDVSRPVQHAEAD